MAEKKYVEVNALFKTVEDYASTHPIMNDNELFALFCSIPAADVPSALWTDEPISGTEFMTHNQGQRGFEIHFRTDDKAKYEAVQDECRRQIDHAKPAADVRPVVYCKDCRNDCHCMIQDFMEDYGITPDDQNNFFCGYGEKEDKKDER